MSGPLGEMQHDVYGLRIAASGDWPEVVEALDRDFAWFPPGTGVPDAFVRYTRRAPDRSNYRASLEAVRITERSAEYRDGARSIADYGRALSVDDGHRSLTVEGQHGWTAWKAGYNFLLNQIDAHLRTIDLVRLNGLGLVGRDGGVVSFFRVAAARRRWPYALSTRAPVSSRKAARSSTPGVGCIPFRFPCWCARRRPKRRLFPAST